MRVDMRNVFAQRHVTLPVGLVQQQKQQVEAGEQRGRQVDVFGGRAGRVVASVRGVGCCKNGCARVEAAGNAGLNGA